MSSTVLLVKNMVCSRCVMAVESILSQSHIPFDTVSIGEVHLPRLLKADQRKLLDLRLKAIGFELIDNYTVAQIEKAKNLIVSRARNEGNLRGRKEKLSLILSEQLHIEYTYLSSLFSGVEGRTIENYFIEQRIEKAKELLVYGQLTLSEIADELEYSSVAHLSAQFKKVTGLTPSHFKQVGNSKRKGLDTI